MLGELSVRPEYREEFKFVYDRLKEEQSVQNLEQSIKEMLQFIMDRADGEEIEEDGFIQSVETYINEKYSLASLSVGMIADEFGMEMSSLSKRYKKERGINISDYIQTFRLKKSKELLADDSYTIKVVAERCGYVNSDVFIRAFKRYEGITPGKYRSYIKIERSVYENQHMNGDG